MHRINRTTLKRDHCVLSNKIDYYQKKLDKLPDLTEVEKIKYNEIVGRLARSFGLSSWMVCSSYWIVISMLVERKAGKIKANIQRNSRLLEQKQIV